VSTRTLEPAEATQLARAQLFASLPMEVVSELARTARAMNLKPRQVLFAQGAPADAVYLVLRGRVKLLETAADGQVVVLRLEGPGELLGLLAALGAGQAYPVTAEASGPGAVARWAGRDWRAVMQRHPALALAVLPVVLARLRAAQDQLRELATERVERRVARVVLRLVRQTGERTPEGVKVDLSLTRQELAEMAGTTLFTVSRLLRQWAAQGVLRLQRRQLLITRGHALVEIAEDLAGTT
jgi:CRP/FNR family transcriptional regulator, nitrogen oxide reductase regulator